MAKVVKSKTKKVKAPSGFHWMKKGPNEYKLMRHTGKFVPHKGGSLVAEFEIQKKHRTMEDGGEIKQYPRAESTTYGGGYPVATVSEAFGEIGVAVPFGVLKKTGSNSIDILKNSIIYAPEKNKGAFKDALNMLSGGESIESVMEKYQDNEMVLNTLKSLPSGDFTGKPFRSKFKRLSK